MVLTANLFIIGEIWSARIVETVAYLLKTRTVKPAETIVARERLCKHARW
jgi:hypothetical protein